MSRFTLLAAMLALSMLCLGTSVAHAQGVGFSGDDPLKYGELYRTFEREHGALVQNFDAELRTLRANGATPAEIQVATERFMNASRRIDAQYRQPVIQKMIDVANLRVSEVVNTGITPPTKPVDPNQPPLPPEKPSVVPGRENPSKLIKPSAGTQPGQPGYRGGLGDTDAAGGVRAVDHLERVAAEMGIAPKNAKSLFQVEPGYVTTDSELQLTAHRSGRLDRVGSNAWQTQIEADALKPETYLSVDMGKDQAGRNYVAVRDHQSKAQKGLSAAPGDLLPNPGQGVNVDGAGKLQGMAKGTLKALDTANLSDDALTALIRKNGIGESPAKVRNVLNALKGGAAIAPDGVGLHAGNMRDFQNLCRDILDESAQTTKAQADEQIKTLTEERDRLERSRNSEDRKRAQKIREELVDSRKRMQESDRSALRKDVDNLNQQRQQVVSDDRIPDSERRQRMQQIDAEIQQRRNRQTVQDLQGDVDRRRVVDGESVIRDLERPRTPVDEDYRRRTFVDDRPEVPPSRRQGVLTHPVVSKGMVWGGQLLATYSGLSAEYEEAKRRLKERMQQQDPNATGEPGIWDVLSEVSYTRVGLRTVAALTGIEGAVIAGQQAKYEWVTGTNNYIDAQVERYRRAGFDELPPGIAMTIAIKATARQVTLSTYQGAKGVPLIGDLVGFPENLFVVTESTVGVLYDKFKTSQTIAQNTIDQLDQERHAAGLAQRLIRDMEALVGDAGRETTALTELWRLVPRAESQEEALRDQFRADYQALEALLAQLPMSTGAELQRPDEANIAQVESEIAALTKELSQLALRCNLLERDLNGGRTECSAVRQWAMSMQGELAEFGRRREALIETASGWTQQLEASGPLAEALQRWLRLRETMNWAAQASTSLEQTAQSAEVIPRNLQSQQARLEYLRQQVLQLHARFSDRAKPGADFQEWEDMRIKLERLKIEIERPTQNVAAAQERLRRTAGYLGLLSRTELPELPVSAQPQRIEGELSEDIARIQPQLTALTRAYDQAHEKLDGLLQLCPKPEPAIRLIARPIDASTFDFEVQVTNVDEQSKYMYVWDFGDEASDAVRLTTHRHKYAKSGTYRVSVRVFEERPDFSAELGEALASVVVEGLPEPTMPTPLSGDVVVSLWAGWKLDLEPPDPPPPPPGKSADEIMQDFGKNFKLPKAGDIFVQLNHLTFRYVPGTSEVEYDFHAETHVTLVDGMNPGYPKHKVEVAGKGRGPINPQTGVFRLRVDHVTWSEDLPNQVPRFAGYRTNEQTGVTVPVTELVPMTAEERAEGLSVAYRALGGPPSAMSWTGQISGQLDWRNFSGGTGRLELNPVFRGTWTASENQAYQIQWPTQIASPNGSNPILLIYPQESAAQRRYRIVTQFGRIWGYQAGPLEDVGDESRASPHGAAIVRHGRWTMDFSRGELRRTSPQAFGQTMQQIQQYIADNRLEQLFPEQPEP